MGGSPASIKTKQPRNCFYPSVDDDDDDDDDDETDSLTRPSVVDDDDDDDDDETDSLTRIHFDS